MHDILAILTLTRFFRLSSYGTTRLTTQTTITYLISTYRNSPTYHIETYKLLK